MNNQLKPIDYNGGKLYISRDTIPNKGNKLIILQDEILWGKKGELCTFEWTEKRRCGIIASNNRTKYTAECDIMYAFQQGNSALVVAQSPKLSIPNIPYVKVEEDVENIVKMLTDKLNLNGWEQNGVRIGYKAASAKKWRDEDIEKAIQFGIDITCKHTTPTHGTNFDKVEDDKNNYIVSLQPKIKSIEIEMEVHRHPLESDKIKIPYKKIVPITYQKDGKTFLKVKKINYE